MSDHVILTKTKNRTKIYFILKYAQNKKKKKNVKTASVYRSSKFTFFS